MDDVPADLLAEIAREDGELPLRLESPAPDTESPAPAESASPPRPATDDTDEFPAYETLPAQPIINGEPPTTPNVGESATPTAPSAPAKPPAFEKLDLPKTVRAIPVSSPVRGESAPPASAVTNDIAPSSDNGADTAKQTAPTPTESEVREDQPLSEKKIKRGKKTKAERKAAKEKKKQRQPEQTEAGDVAV